MRIDNLPENDLTTRLANIDRDITELKNQQTIGKHSTVPARVFNNVTYDIRVVTGAVAVRQVLITFTPTNNASFGGIAYTCLASIVAQSNLIASMEYRLDRQPLKDLVTYKQKWILTVVNDSGAGQPNNVDFKMYIYSSGGGTIETTLIT